MKNSRIAMRTYFNRVAVLILSYIWFSKSQLIHSSSIPYSSNNQGRYFSRTSLSLYEEFNENIIARPRISTAILFSRPSQPKAK